MRPGQIFRTQTPHLSRKFHRNPQSQFEISKYIVYTNIACLCIRQLDKLGPQELRLKTISRFKASLSRDAVILQTQLSLNLTITYRATLTSQSSYRQVIMRSNLVKLSFDDISSIFQFLQKPYIIFDIIISCHEGILQYNYLRYDTLISYEFSKLYQLFKKI